MPFNYFGCSFRSKQTRNCGENSVSENVHAQITGICRNKQGQKRVFVFFLSLS